MKLRLLLLLLLPTTAALAQPVDVYLGSQRQPVRLSLMSVYQRYVDDDRYISQLSFPVSGFFPLGDQFAVSLLASPASVAGQDMEGLGGLTDAQVALSYHQRLGGASLVASLSTNLPSGQEQLTPAEYETAQLLSQNYYNFRVPTFGQGFNISPGLTVALPLSDGFVLGIGGAYQYRGSFEPSGTLLGEYDPGDEILVTGGADVRVGETSSIAGDVTYTIYQKDQVGDAEVYTSGNKLTATAQYLQYFGSNNLRLVGRYRTRAKSDLPYASGGIGSEAIRTVPDNFEFRSLFTTQFPQRTAVTWLAQGRYFSELDNLESKFLVDIGAMPSLALSENVNLISRFVYTAGSFTGAEAGVGISVVL